RPAPLRLPPRPRWAWRRGAAGATCCARPPAAAAADVRREPSIARAEPPPARAQPVGALPRVDRATPAEARGEDPLGSRRFRPGWWGTRARVVIWRNRDRRYRLGRADGVTVLGADPVADTRNLA